MTRSGDDVDTGDAAARAHRAVEEVGAGPVVRAVGRAGLVAYGIVHLLIAGLAAQVALGQAERADKAGALAAVAGTGAGVALLWPAVVGLGALVVWQLAEAAFGHRREHGRARAVRVGVNLAEAGIFGALAWSAGKAAAGGGSSGPASSAGLFALPGGRWLVGAAGLAVLALAGYAMYRGVTARFLRELDLRGAGLRRSFLVTRLGRVGWTALGAAYAAIGALLVVSAVRYDPDRPVGLDAALKSVADEPIGPPVILALAAGLAVFGGYCFFDARYRAA